MLKQISKFLRLPFVDDTPAKPPVKIRASEAIRKGAGMIPENRHIFVQDYGACALGTGWIGSGKTVKDWDKARDFGQSCMQVLVLLADQLNIPIVVAREVSCRHFRGESRLVLADWLEAQGY